MNDDARDHGVTPYVHLLVTMAVSGSALASSKTVVGELPHQVAAALRFGGGALVLGESFSRLKRWARWSCWRAPSWRCSGYRPEKAV
ncbi:hypothetical protein ACRAKI_15045 [Saccharothrix isguenensis]